MDYSGLTYKYKVNRPLTDEEMSHQLRQGKRLDVDPLYQLSVIRMNSTYLEMVDKYYAWKGFLTLFTTFVLGAVSWFLVAITLISLQRAAKVAQGEAVEEFLFLSIFFLIASPLLIAAFWLLRKESFRHTHYPIRLNRKTRMVHVFRLDGTVLSAPWDEVFFTLGQAQMGGTYDVRGHLLDADGMIKESFSLSFTGMVTKSDLENPEKQEGNYVRRYWEFVRRYMEEGPGQLINKVEFVMPVANKRESVSHGFSRLNANWGPFWPLMLPVTLLTWVGRCIAMQTCKVPQWPQRIEDECGIVPDDPFVRDRNTNAPDARVA